MLNSEARTRALILMLAGTRTVAQILFSLFKTLNTDLSPSTGSA